MRVTILGSGFGLYGYLPALLQTCQATVILPERYQKTLMARSDICHFYGKIQWATDHDTILSMCDAAVFALSPEQQFHSLKTCLAHKNITHFFLEKPLASSPNLGNELLDLLESSGKKFRIGYNFRYTDWGKLLLSNTGDIRHISWRFRAHHYTKNIQTWKRIHKTGGGALRFYGIHLIALLAEAGYRDVSFSKIKEGQSDEVEDWQAELIGTNLPTCNLSVETNSNQVSFLVQNNHGNVYSDLEPFPTQQNTDNAMDKRIPFLSEGLLTLFNQPESYYDWYRQVNLLWQKVEASLS